VRVVCSGDQRAGPARGAGRARRRELGAFLRSRRARLRPAEVGLPDWGVRRGPRARRGEGVPASHRAPRRVPSPDTVFALARDPADQARGPEDHLRTPASAGPALDTLVRGFEPAPAYAISARFDVLAHNRPAGLLFGDLGPGPGGLANM